MLYRLRLHLVSCPANNYRDSPRPLAPARVAAPRHITAMSRRRAVPGTKTPWRLAIVICGTGH
jgi:hypothetical protein